MLEKVIFWVGRVIAGLVIIAILAVIIIFGIAPAVRNASASQANAPVVANNSQVTDLQNQVAAQQTKINDLTEQLNAEKNAPAVDTQANADLQAQVADLQAKLDQANTDLAATQTAMANAFNFLKYGDIQVVDIAKMTFPSEVVLRVGIEAPGGGWLTAIYFATDTPHISISRLVCDDTCLKVEYFPAGGTPVVLLDKSANVDLFKMVWVGGPEASTIPAEVFNVMKARGVADQEQLQQNVYQVYLGDVPKDSWIEVTFADNAALQVNKGSNVSLTKDIDQMTRNFDGSMAQDISYFVPGMEDFRWTNVEDSFSTTP